MFDGKWLTTTALPQLGAFMVHDNTEATTALESQSVAHDCAILIGRGKYALT